MAKSVGNIFLLHEALDAYGRDALIMYFFSGHYRQPIEFDDERLEQARASVRRIREAARAARAGRRRRRGRRALKETLLRGARGRLQHADGAGGRVRVDPEANRAAAGTVGSADLAEMLGVLALDNLLAADEEQAPAEVRELVEARERARKARDCARGGPPARRGPRARVGGPGRPDGPEVLPLQ